MRGEFLLAFHVPVGITLTYCFHNYDTMFEDELREITDKADAIKNLKTALLSLGTLILAGSVSYMAMDSFYIGHSNMLTWLFIISSYGFMVLAVAIAVIALRGALTAVRTSRLNRNYFAMAISILVLLAVAVELLKRL
jgi:hypothetical protein